MSGVEIAGILLGSFPLLISALEHYRESAEVLEDWWEIKREYKKCKNEIKVQELAFEANMEQFLLPLIADDNELHALLAEPGGAQWKDPALEDTLKGRLPRSYDLFLDTINDIQITVDGLKDELGVSREAFQKGLQPGSETKRSSKSSSPLRKLFKQAFQKEKHTPRQTLPENHSEKNSKKWLTRPNFEYQTQRVKFGFGRANRDKLFADFARYNSRLGDLLDTNDKSAALRQSREQVKKSTIQKAVCKLWRRATDLHSLLDGAWCCQCKNTHRVQLLLHHHPSVERTPYNIYFLYGTDVIQPLPWTCVEVQAQQTIDNELRGGVTLKVPQAQSKPACSTESSPKTVGAPKSALRSRDASSLGSRPRVNWIDTSASSLIKSTTANSQLTGSIDDMCASIANCDPTSTYLGVLQGDESYSLHREARSHTIFQNSVSLETLLTGSGGIKLDRRQRYTIAFTLVSSHLQLYPSPWLGSHWSKRDIVFAKDSGDSGSIEIDRPYILQDGDSQKQRHSSAYAFSDRLLVTLGILLIELCFGTVIEHHEMRRQYQQSGKGRQDDAANLEAALDLAVALEWSRSVGGEAGDAYADAVHWCLRGQRADAKNDSWRQELFTNVVLPLQYCYEQLYPKTT